MNEALRDRTAHILRRFLTVKNQTDSSRAFMVGYLAAVRHTGSIDLPEYEAAMAAVDGRDIPTTLRSRIWWGLVV